MDYTKDFRDKGKIGVVLDRIRAISRKPLRLMEVCGGHTMAIHRFGIPSLLPGHIRLLSGPGCPVCVTDRRFIDQAVAYARMPGVCVATYGDLLRVPGSSSTLEREKARGADVRVAYSVLDVLDWARRQPRLLFVFLGIGFETTTPSTAAGLVQAQAEDLDNFLVLSAHKLMPPAMSALVDEGVPLEGYLAPGHVSVIAGAKIFEPLARRHGKAVAVVGFEPLDILQGVAMLAEQVESGSPRVQIQYSRVVSHQGNLKAQALVERVFRVADHWWRGLGVLPASGLEPREEFARWDAARRLPVEPEPTRDPAGCICGDILRGTSSPSDCKLFGRVCTTSNPVGSCMVSEEGACQAHYRYNHLARR